MLLHRDIYPGDDHFHSEDHYMMVLVIQSCHNTCVPLGAGYLVSKTNDYSFFKIGCFYYNCVESTIVSIYLVIIGAS